MPLNADQKSRLKAALADTCVKDVQTTLEKGADDFMSSIGSRVDRYKVNIARVSAHVEKLRVETNLASNGAVANADAPTTAGTADATSPTTAPSAVAMHTDPKISIPQDPVAPTTAELAAAAEAADAANPVFDGPVIGLMFPNNTVLLHELSVLKSEAYELALKLDNVTDWIAMSIPAIKNDNSNSVDIMGSVLEQLSSLLDATRSIFTLTKKYLSDRSEMETGLLKVPICTGLSLGVGIVDSDCWDSAEKAWKTLLRVSLIAHSILTKNLDGLKNPEKASESSFLYQ